MFFKGLMVSAIALGSIQANAAVETYSAPEYNSGNFIQHVELEKKGPRYYMDPEQPYTPQLDPDQVLVGIGVRAGKTTVTTVRLSYRSIDSEGNFGPIEEKYFGSKPFHEIECEFTVQEEAAIVGLAFRINGSDDFRFLEVKYRKFGDDGELLENITTVTGYDYDANRHCNDPGTHVEAAILPEGDRVITGVGIVNHDEDVDSLWIYRGNYTPLANQ